MAQVALLTEPTTIPGAVPWGWRDILRAIVLSVVSLVVLFVVLVIAVAALHFIPILLPMLFVIGLLLTFVRARTDSIIPGILIHAMNNAVFVLGVYAAFHGPAS